MSVEWGKIVRSINWTVVLQWVNFGLLLYVLKRLLFKPALEFLDKRRDQIAAQMQAAKQSENEAAQLVQDQKKALQEARTRAERLLEDARKQAEEVIAQARNAAKKDASKILEDGKQRLEQERDQMIADLRSAYAEIAVLGAERVLDREVRIEDHQRLLDQLLEELDGENLRIAT